VRHENSYQAMLFLNLKNSRGTPIPWQRQPQHLQWVLIKMQTATLENVKNIL
jgi:hypothetical protein